MTIKRTMTKARVVRTSKWLAAFLALIALGFSMEHTATPRVASPPASIKFQTIGDTKADTDKGDKGQPKDHCDDDKGKDDAKNKHCRPPSGDHGDDGHGDGSDGGGDHGGGGKNHQD